MTTPDALKILNAYQRWRRDRSDVNPYPMPEPKLIGQAIDVAMNVMKDSLKHSTGEPQCRISTK